MEVPRWEILKKPFWATQTWPWASFSFFALFDLKTKKFRNLPTRLGRFQQIFLAFLSCDKISPKSGHEWEKETFFISTKKTILDRKECMAQKIFPLPDGPILFIYFFELNWRQTNKQTYNRILQNKLLMHYNYNYLPITVWPDWAIYWTLGNFSKPVATIILPKCPHFSQFL